MCMNVYSCQNKESCSLPVYHCYLENGVDPCSGTSKYLQVEYQCCDTSMISEVTVRACESDTDLELSCPSGQVVHCVLMIENVVSYNTFYIKTLTIFAANFGRTEFEGLGDMCPGKRSGLVKPCYGTTAMINAASR